MPKFIQDILDNLDFEMEIAEFLDEEIEEYFPDAFVPEDIMTM